MDEILYDHVEYILISTSAISRKYEWGPAMSGSTLTKYFQILIWRGEDG